MNIDIIKFMVWETRTGTGNGDFKWVDIKYEYFLTFFFVCGRISYIDRNCLKEEEEESEDIFILYEELFKVYFFWINMIWFLMRRNV